MNWLPEGNVTCTRVVPVYEGVHEGAQVGLGVHTPHTTHTTVLSY
jgi:hypothetical protein